jgi:CelD/BcsL family acetyltransferase involved in cellulose biosynthesis
MSDETARLRLTDKRWLALVSSHPKAVAFHHPAWTRVLAETYGLRGFVWALRDNGRITAGLPLLETRKPLAGVRWVSLPFSDACVPLANPDELDPLLQSLAADARAAGVQAVEVRGQVDTAGYGRRVAAVQHILHLDEDADAIVRRFHPSQVRANIRRGERGPVRLRRADSMRDLTELFYDLHTRARQRQGIPVQSRRFFEALWRHMLEPGLGYCVLAEIGSTPVAGAVFLTWNGTTTYKFGASDPASLRHRPNHLIFWHAIQSAMADGHHAFDFGRTDVEHDSLQAFKRTWGTEEAPLYYSWAGRTQGDQFTPTLRAGMAGVIRHSPLWVTRVLGEVLYPLTA